MKKGFARVESQIKEGFADSDRRFARVEAQIAANRKETNEGFTEMRAEMSRGFAEMPTAHLALNRALLAAAAAIVATLIGAHIL